MDLTSGQPASREYFLPSAPSDPELRESASMWIFDQEGAISIPRAGIEAVGSSWDRHGFQVNVGLPEGRAVIVREAGASGAPADADGVHRTMQAGALEFRCVEPFTTWTMSYEGKALDTSADALARGDLSDARPVDLQVRVEAAMAAPPWIPGALVEEAEQMMSGEIEGQFISDRYEQLCRATSNVTIGSDDYVFEGGGLRIRRLGRRNVEGFWGHCWQSALFPDGRGFGYLSFPPRPDGAPSFNEGYLFDGERLIAATAVEVPWLRRLTPYGEDVSLVLRTADGDTRIAGELAFSTFVAGGQNPEFVPVLQQAGVRYSWDGQETYGMMERSIPVDQLEP
jgi:hypothetical protein